MFKRLETVDDGIAILSQHPAGHYLQAAALALQIGFGQCVKRSSGERGLSQGV